MSNQSLLSKLVSLSEEDFLTAAFSHLLQQDHKFRKKYLRGLGLGKVDNLTVRPWRPYGLNAEDRPDMELDGSETLILQENKVDSPEGRNQLQRYAKRLAQSRKRRRLLVYMSRDAPDTRLRTARYPVPVRFLRWEFVANLLRSRSKVHQKNIWLREELYNFMLEKQMIAPPPVDVKQLIRHWQGFEPQRRALLRIIEHSRERLTDSLDSNRYGCGPDPASDGLGLYVSRKKGKLAKPMSGRYLWVWGGFNLEDDNRVYVSLGIGWVRKFSEKIGNRVRIFLKSRDFQNFNVEYDEYYAYKNIRQLIGNTYHLETQSERISSWMLDRTKEALNALDKIELAWR